MSFGLINVTLLLFCYFCCWIWMIESYNTVYQDSQFLILVGYQSGLRLVPYLSRLMNRVSVYRYVSSFGKNLKKLTKIKERNCQPVTDGIYQAYYSIYHVPY